jgi:translation initiation factor IF-3
MPRDNEKVRINEEIRVPEVRVIGSEGENLGVLTVQEALRKARAVGLDLIEISPKAKPPVAKITDYGKYSYEAKKKAKDMKSKQVKTETKVAQVKIGTGENDLKRKADKVALWLQNGHRVKVDLFLWGRYKYMDFAFLKERLERFLAIIPESFKIADIVKKSPKGLTTVIEIDKTGVGVVFDFQKGTEAKIEKEK